MSNAETNDLKRVSVMRIHSETAWNLASKFSGGLASETRDLAALIDEALAAERERCAKIAENERYPGDIPPNSHDGAYNRACVDIAMVIRGDAPAQNAVTREKE